MSNGDELRVAKLLLSEDLPLICFNNIRYYKDMTRVANKCLSDPEQINIIFLWDNTTKYLRDNGVYITKDYFSEYRNGEKRGSEFFRQVFKDILFPPSPKPLEEWL